MVDRDLRFSSFRPASLAFTEVGKLRCPVADPSIHPVSMSVDRAGRAWILYSSGRIYQVDIYTAACTETPFDGESVGFTSFGMGFASQGPGSRDETLYIAGGLSPLTDPNPPALAALDLRAFTIERFASLRGLPPELTGTGDGKLWGFFPQHAGTAGAALPYIAGLDKRTGAERPVFTLPSLAGVPRAWAFAFWGGGFYLFLQREGESSTRVYRVDAQNGASREVIADTGRVIVGAGVSTCAPIGQLPLVPERRLFARVPTARPARAAARPRSRSEDRHAPRCRAAG